jgi:hypothetical protein
LFVVHFILRLVSEPHRSLQADADAAMFARGRGGLRMAGISFPDKAAGPRSRRD